MKFQPLASLAALLPLIGLGLQIYGTLKAGQAAGTQAAAAERSSAMQEETLKEYLKDYKEMRPYRQYLGTALSGRAGKPSRFTRAWGGGGDFYGQPDFPSFEEWKTTQGSPEAPPTQDPSLPGLPGPVRDIDRLPDFVRSRLPNYLNKITG